MNLSLSKYSFVLIAFAMFFVACESDSESSVSEVTKASVESSVADASNAALDKAADMAKKSEELLEIYVSPENKAASEKAVSDDEKADKEAEALASINRKIEIEREKIKAEEGMTNTSPVKKVVAPKPTPVKPKPVEVSNDDEEAPLAPTKISFKNKVHEYGMIMQGDKVNHKFKFTNSGSEDLVISDVSASCGCTKPSYPFIPIGPGKTGYIGVKFDSAGKLGRQKPSVTVVSNAGTTKLYLEGFVDAERAGQPKADAPKIEIIDDAEMDKLKEEALKTAPKENEGGR